MAGTKSELWFFGAIDKLANFGFLKAVPLEIKVENSYIFWFLDEIRDELFTSNLEIDYFVCAYFPYLSDDDMNMLIELVIAFKDNRSVVFSTYLKEVLSVK